MSRSFLDPNRARKKLPTPSENDEIPSPSHSQKLVSTFESVLIGPGPPRALSWRSISSGADMPVIILRTAARGGQDGPHAFGPILDRTLLFHDLAWQSGQAGEGHPRI